MSFLSNKCIFERQVLVNSSENTLPILFICTGNKGKLEEFQSSLSEFFNVVGIRQLQNLYELDYKEPPEDNDSFLQNAFVKLQSALDYLETCSRKACVPINKIANFVLVDDSGLCVPALNYLPGVHSATFGGEPRCDLRNRKKLQESLKTIGSGCSEAFFVCFLLLFPITESELLGGLSFKEPLTTILEIERREFLEKAKDGCLAGKAVVSSHCNIAVVGCQSPSFARVTSLQEHPLKVFFGSCSGFVHPEDQQLIPEAGHGYDPMFYGIKSPTLSFASIPLSEKNLVSHRGVAVQELMNSFHN